VVVDVVLPAVLGPALFVRLYVPHYRDDIWLCLLVLVGEAGVETYHAGVALAVCPVPPSVVYSMEDAVYRLLKATYRLREVSMVPLSMCGWCYGRTCDKLEGLGNPLFAVVGHGGRV
jgi:hypothetical protein